MIRNYLLFTLLFLSSYIFSQKKTFDEPQWKINVYFADATGAKDTLTIGYDPSASPYISIIDPQFDEGWIQIDTTKFNVYLRQFSTGNTSPEWPPIGTDMVRKKSITSWSYPDCEFAWMHGEVPITMTWDEPQLDSPNLPSIFTDLEPYPRARIDIWLNYWFECVFPDCVDGCPISDPQPPNVILTSYTDYVWSMAPCVLSDFLIWDPEYSTEIDENVIDIPSLTIRPFEDEFWLGDSEYKDVKITIYPNPANDILYINIKNDEVIHSVQIYNVQGESLLKEKSRFEQLDISFLLDGIYLIRVKTDKGIISKRIIIG